MVLVQQKKYLHNIFVCEGKCFLIGFHTNVHTDNYFYKIQFEGNKETASCKWDF